MTSCTIRPVRSTEVEALARIGRRTFESTFARGNSPADLKDYVERAFGVERVSDELRTPGSQFFFAEVNGEVAGYLKLNSGGAQTEPVEGATLEVERIYVDDHQQGLGVGKAMLDFAFEEAQRQGCDTIWLGVWENNPKAIRFYERQGFVAFGRHNFVIGTDTQTDILMRSKVVDGGA